MYDGDDLFLAIENRRYGGKFSGLKRKANLAQLGVCNYLCSTYYFIWRVYSCTSIGSPSIADSAKLSQSVFAAPSSATPVSSLNA